MNSIFARYLRDNRHFLEQVQESHITLCETIAELAHEGDTRWNGDDYKSSHLTRIVDEIDSQEWAIGEHTIMLKCVAWLHDVLEDARDKGYDSHKLIESKVPLPVVQEVRHLTRLPTESYLPYIIRLCNSNSPFAMAVKLYDIKDNLSDLDTYKGTERHRDSYELSRYIVEQKWNECSEGDFTWIP